MPLDDIADTMKAYNLRQEHNQRERLSEMACMTYADACFSAVALYNPKKFPRTLHEAYPRLFGSPEPVNQDWREMKAYMQNFAKQRKKLRKEG